MTTTSPSTIETTDLVRMRAEDPALHILDVRTPGEYQTAHIEGSYNVPLDVLGEHASDLAALGHPVVLVCQSGARATKAVDHLVSAGKSNLRLLAGGMNAWTAAGGDVRRAAADRWSLERQVRLVAGAIVFLAVLVSIMAPPVRYVAGAVGAGLMFAAITDTCTMGMILSKLPHNRGPRCDMDEVLDQLTLAEV